jgi:hypothetical protein
MTTQMAERIPARIEPMGSPDPAVRRESEGLDRGPKIGAAPTHWRQVVWVGWILGIATVWGGGGIVAAAAWWILYWPAIMAGAMLYSLVREGQTPSQLAHRPASLAD